MRATALNEHDRRVGKTRKAIIGAFGELLQEQKYAEITIQDIIDAANVGRTTFYTHYTSKDDLLKQYVGIIFDHIKLDNPTSGKAIPVGALFRHIKENRDIIKGLINIENVLLMDMVTEYFHSLIGSEMFFDAKIAVPHKLLVHYVTNTFMGLVQYWLNNGMLAAPAKMENYFYALVKPLLADMPD